jgi:5-formyltetrahydrofolate cyclo-ligase
MIKGADITRQTLLQHLSKGFCKIQFRKQTNGQFRSLVCTLNPKQIPAKFAKGIAETMSGGKDPSLVPVFDVVARDWKSFYIPNVLYFYTEDELRGNKGNKPSGTEVKNNEVTKNAKRTPNRREAKAPQAKRKN